MLGGFILFETTQNNRLISSLREISDNILIGAKTKNLYKLKAMGCTVPNFIAITSDVAVKIHIGSADMVAIENEIKDILNCERYAVRSSALIEDSKYESFAGQFLTKTNVESQNIGAAIVEIINHANIYLERDLSKFSLIVQEYIEPDFSGVVFTRNPFGSREMIIEFHAGKGEQIVGGEVKPTTASFYWNQEIPKELDVISQIKNAVIQIKETEKTFEFPQDIEWCTQNGKFYFLQTRSITSITEKQFEQIKFLESVLPTDYFYFSKTSISEIAPRPCSITLDLLKKIYADDGPVFNVYKKYKIRYRYTEFLKVIGNELFIDMEKELCSLLPAYSYNSENFQPKINDISKFPVTLKNLFYINKINSKEDLFKRIKAKIEEPFSNKPLDECLEVFLNDYELVFEINLLAESNLKKLEYSVKNEDVTIPEIGNGSEIFVNTELNIETFREKLAGNSLDISDETEFYYKSSVSNNDNAKLLKWWNGLTDFKKKFFEKNIIQFLYFNQLREFGRWLVVKHISDIRKQLLLLAEKSGFSSTRNIYFSTFQDIANGNFNEIDCQKEQANYMKFSDYYLPMILSNSLITNKNETLGVSSGKCTGVLLDLKSLKDEKYSSSNKILYTDILSPELVRYFDDIKGIVSASGGMLSHLAIIARERKIPVIVNFTLTGNINIGEIVEIDGENGSINKLKTGL